MSISFQVVWALVWRRYFLIMFLTLIYFTSYGKTLPNQYLTALLTLSDIADNQMQK